ASLRDQRGKFGNQKIWDLDVQRIDPVEQLLARFVGRPKRINSGIVDQDIDMAVAKLNRFSRNLTDTGCIQQVRRDKIRLPSRRTYCRNRLLPVFRIAAYDQDMDAQLGKFVGGRPTNAARTAGS